MSKCIFKSSSIKNLGQGGQVVVEYTLMLVVIITLVLTAYQTIKERFDFNPAACAEPDNFNPICSIQTLTNTDGDEASKFRTFRLAR